MCGTLPSLMETRAYESLSAPQEPMKPTSARVNVLGVGVNPTNMSETLDVIETHLGGDRKGYVCVTGVHGIMEAQKNSDLRDVINGSLITIPDGRPTVWVGWLSGFRHMRQVTGPHMMLKLCARSVEKGYTHFFYGGAPGVAEELKRALQTRFPGLKVVGTYTPPFRKLSIEEERELIDQVATLKPDLFWIGLSTPKQEAFMAEYLQKLDTKLMLAVGAAFDIHTGRIADSAPWLQALGLQWLHRLLQDPKRLWKRYLKNNPRFLYLIAMQLLGIKQYELTASTPPSGLGFQA
jgi:N-acetylglucosaminyldiphosphoundecaprenol N-acetyl-beta-D-mannosaminyltransferase